MLGGAMAGDSQSQGFGRKSGKEWEEQKWESLNAHLFEQ
jgi:hypothetical protein